MIENSYPIEIEIVKSTNDNLSIKAIYFQFIFKMRNIFFRF
jgi:hypothetical protein